MPLRTVTRYFVLMTGMLLVAIMTSAMVHALLHR